MSPFNILLGFFFLAICSNSRSQKVFAINASTAENPNNCSNYRGSRPHVFPLTQSIATYAQKGDTRATSVSIVRNEQSGANILDSLQFNCTHNEPVHWVFHWDPVNEDDIGIEIDFSERTITSGVDNTEEPIYTYTSNFQLNYIRKGLPDSTLFSCEPIQMTNPCERTFIQIQGSRFNNFPTFVPHKSLNALSDLLLKSTRDKTIPMFHDKESCPLRLFLKIQMGNRVSFRWEASNGSTRGIHNTTRATNETTYLNNVFRLNRTNEPHCVHILNETQVCTGCRDARKINYTTNAVILHGSYKNITLVYKGFFSVSVNERSQRKFYFDWQISESIIQKHMMQLIVPKNIYAGFPFKVKCRVSIFLFSHGTRITDNESFDFEETSSNTREYFNREGYRELTRTMIFPEALQAKLVSCISPQKTSHHPIVKSVPILVQTATAPVIDNTPNVQNITIFQTISEGTEFIVAECNVSGNPIPTLHWIYPSKLPVNLRRNLNVTRGENFLKIRFPKWESEFAGTYTCYAKNFVGVTMKIFTFQHKVEESDTRLAVVISSSLGVFVILLGAVIGFLAWKIRIQRLEFEIQTQKAIDEFRNGINSDNMPELNTQDPNFSILQMPYNEAFEVSQDKWTIEDKILGTGQFGIVRMGSVILKAGTVNVAVKSLKSSVEIDEFKSFLFELKIMAYLGQHRNIVSLIAACTEGINNRDIVIGVEFCDNGCLLDYLRKYRASFLNMVGPDGNIVSDLPTILNRMSDYANVSTFSTHQLYRWAYHIACGMDFLRIRKVLHGDLAARNVLLTSRNVAKVGDFGLSRVLMNSENYTKKTQTALPWKWMAIESLTEKSTNASPGSTETRTFF